MYRSSLALLAVVLLCVLSALPAGAAPDQSPKIAPTATFTCTGGVQLTASGLNNPSAINFVTGSTARFILSSVTYTSGEQVLFSTGIGAGQRAGQQGSTIACSTTVDGVTFSVTGFLVP